MAAKKMRIVTDEVYQQLINGNLPDPNRQHAVPPKPPAPPMTELDILNDATIPPVKKWKMLQAEWYRNHELMTSKRGKPVKVQIEKGGGDDYGDDDDDPIKSEPVKSEPVDADDGIPYFLTRIPGSLRNRAREMFQFLNRERGIGWGEDGTIYIGGTEIYDSSISELVSHALKPVRGKEPIGWSDFCAFLIKVKAPEWMVSPSVLKGSYAIKRRGKTKQVLVTPSTSKSPTSTPNTRYQSKKQKEVDNNQNGKGQKGRGRGLAGKKKKYAKKARKTPARKTTCKKKTRPGGKKRFGWKAFG